MKLAPRIVTAALAVAIAIAVPFVTPAQPAEAAETPDLWVEFREFEPTVGLNAVPKAKFWIHSEKADVLQVYAFPACIYLTPQGHKEIAPPSGYIYLPGVGAAYFIPKIGKGHTYTYRVECGTYQGYKPQQAKLRVSAANEAQSDKHNNSKVVTFPGWFD